MDRIPFSQQMFRKVTTILPVMPVINAIFFTKLLVVLDELLDGIAQTEPTKEMIVVVALAHRQTPLGTMVQRTTTTTPCRQTPVANGGIATKSNFFMSTNPIHQPLTYSLTKRLCPISSRCLRPKSGKE